MDDVQAIEQRISREMHRRAGPSEPVDDAKIFSAITATRSSSWGFGFAFTAVRYVMAIGILALFGGVLFAGIVRAPEDQEVAPAATSSPSPTATDTTLFPTGTFVSEDDDLTLEFRADGTCSRAGTPCTYGVRGLIYSEMTFEDPSGPSVPAVYLWRFDGEHLTFEPRDNDPRPARTDTYVNHVYRPVGDTRPLPGGESDFPIGSFVSTSDSDTVLSLLDNGIYAGSETGGRYTVSGNRFTAMHTGSNLALVPATYYWDWDGENLTFRLWGEDDNPWRTSQLLGHVFVKDASATVLGATRRLMLSDPRLEFFVTVEIRELSDGQYSAAASIDEEPLGEGVGDTPQAAVRDALEEELGEPMASDLAKRVPG